MPQQGKTGLRACCVAALAALALLAACQDANQQPAGPRAEPLAVDDVNPRIGTGGQGWWAGSALIGATRPFGLVQVGPDTELRGQGALPWNHCSGYHAGDDTVRAFSHTHLHGTGIPDLGAIGFMPVPGVMTVERLGRGHFSRIDKASEVSEPGYYAVTLVDHGIRVELTATERAAHHRYRFVDGAAGRMTVLIDVGHTLPGGVVLDGGVNLLLGTDDSIEIGAWALNENGFTREGGGVKQYVMARFDRLVVDAGTWSGTDLGSMSPTQREGADTGAWLTFNLTPGEVLEARVGVSYVTSGQAFANLEAEIPEPGFDATLEAATAAWSEPLSMLRVAGGTEAKRTILATSLYHAMLMPTLLSDANGQYPGFDGETHTAPAGDSMYSNYSLWDTYRGLHSLLMLVASDRQADLMRSMIRAADEGGYLFKWPVGNLYTNIMIGTPADIVLAETWLKGIQEFDGERAYAHMRATAEGPTSEDQLYVGRDGIADIIELGYMAADRGGGSVAKTQESCIADFALARMASALNRADDAVRYDARAKSYRNLWHEQSGYFRPRNADGSWVEPFDPFHGDIVTGAFTEGNALQYLWLVPQDPFGLMTLIGGQPAMAERLEAMFEAAVVEQQTIFSEAHEPIWWMANHPQQYWHGNEPDIHAAYLFLQAGRPDLTQKWVHWIADSLYHTGTDGIPGNDDAGTLAAWYVFATLGFFPVFGSDLYLVGSPFFERAELDLGGGKTLVVEAPGAGEGQIYVGAVSLNGEALELPWFRHAEIAGGAVLRFEMSETPAAWGVVDASEAVPTVPGQQRAGLKFW